MSRNRCFRYPRPMRRGLRHWTIGLISMGAVHACGEREIRYPPPPAPTAAPQPVAQPVAAAAAPAPVAAAAAPVEPEPPAVGTQTTATAKPPTPDHVFEPARRFVKQTKLALYRYHSKHIGNAAGFLAPILHTRDGGFLVVGTRRPPGKYRVGVSRPIVAKLDASGTKVWERAYTSGGFLDYEGASAVELSDGYIVYILSYVHPARGSVVRLLRIDQKGTKVWDTKLRGNGRAGTPHPQNLQLVDQKVVMDGHIYKDTTETAYGWSGSIDLDGNVLSDQVGAANPYK